MREVNLAAFAGDEPGDGEQRAAGHHLHPGGEHRLRGQRRVARVERPGRPGGRREDADEPADEVGPGTAAARRDEQRDAAEPDEQPRPAGDREPPAEENPVEEREPERHRRHEERRDARVHALLGPRDPAVPDGEERAARNERRDPRAHAEPLAPRRRDRKEEAARDEEPRRRHEERRHRPDREHDSEIRRAPDHVQRGQGAPGARGHGVGLPTTDPAAVVHPTRVGAVEHGGRPDQHEQEDDDCKSHVSRMPTVGLLAQIWL